MSDIFVSCEPRTFDRSELLQVLEDLVHFQLAAHEVLLLPGPHQFLDREAEVAGIPELAAHVALRETRRRRYGLCHHLVGDAHFLFGISREDFSLNQQHDLVKYLGIRFPQEGGNLLCFAQAGWRLLEIFVELDKLGVFHRITIKYCIHGFNLII